MPQASPTPSSSRDRFPNQDQGSVSEVTAALHVPSESNNLSLISKTKDLSDDVKTVKRKLSNISQEVVSKRKRVPSEDGVHNHESAYSLQPSSPLNKDLSHMLSQTSVQEPISCAVEMHDVSAKSGSGTSVSNKGPSSSGNQRLMEKDFASQRSLKSSANFNP